MEEWNIAEVFNRYWEFWLTPNNFLWWKADYDPQENLIEHISNWCKETLWKDELNKFVKVNSKERRWSEEEESWVDQVVEVTVRKKILDR